MELGAGAVLAGYRIQRRLGGGGMGTVYLARHPRLPRWDAVKVLDSRLAVDATFRARFEREADLAARLRHPNVVQIYDRGVDGERLWIAMQYVDGIDVAQLLRQGLAVLPADRAVTIVAEAASGAVEWRIEVQHAEKSCGDLSADEARELSRVLAATADLLDRLGGEAPPFV